MKLRLQKILKEKGISQRELAKRIGMTAQGVSLIAKGAHIPPISTIIKIAAEIGVSPRYLMDFEDANDFNAIIVCKGEYFCASSLAELKEITALLSQDPVV